MNWDDILDVVKGTAVSIPSDEDFSRVEGSHATILCIKEGRIGAASDGEAAFVFHNSTNPLVR